MASSSLKQSSKSETSSKKNKNKNKEDFSSDLDLDVVFSRAIKKQKTSRLLSLENKRLEEKNQKLLRKQQNLEKEQASAFSSDASFVAGTTTSSKKEDVPDYVNSLKGTKTRKKTQEGYRIYSERELKVFDYATKSAVYTKECPFDCKCCF